jgi:hypothetical protein
MIKNIKKNCWNDEQNYRFCKGCGDKFKSSPAANRKFCSTKCRDLNRPTGDKAQHWKGDAITYHGLHQWMQHILGKPTKCVFCGRDGLVGCKIHWANVSKEYKRDSKDWLRLCASCHFKYDMTPERKEFCVSNLNKYRHLAYAR